jgi:hypothetical protein
LPEFGQIQEERVLRRCIHEVSRAAVWLVHFRNTPFAETVAEMVEPDIAQDGEEPGFQTAVGPEPLKGTDGAEIGFLNQVFGGCP